jgi:hypothetical protein
LSISMTAWSSSDSSRAYSAHPNSLFGNNT